MGSDYNWKMVFGKNKWLWFIPITTGEGAPLGDGVVINKIETSFSRVKSDMIDYNENQESHSDQGYKDPLNKRLNLINANQASNPLNKDICKKLYFSNYQIQKSIGDKTFKRAFEIP